MIGLKKYLIAEITFFGGFFMILILSIFTRVFWFSSNLDFPLITSPIILIGDSFLLPVINYRIYIFIRNNFRKLSIDRKILIIYVFASFLISIALNIFTHFYIWTNNQYTGYFNPTPNHFSIVCWWHFAFSIVQMWLIAIFILFWVCSIKVLTRKEFKYNIVTWGIFVCFCLLEIGNFLVKHLIVLKTSNLAQAFLNDEFSFVLLLLSILIYLTSIIISKMKFWDEKQ